MKNKGFTLIELLAVIVILAIVAIIAVPIILNIIDSSKESATKRSKELYLTAVEQAIARKNLTSEFNPTSCKVDKSGNLNCDGITLTIETEGNRPCSGDITFKNGKVESESIGFTCESGEVSEVPTPVSFEEDEWETIIANVRAGNASLYDEDIGQTKTVTLTGTVTGTFKVRLANTTTPPECSNDGFSQTACGFVVEFEDIITTHAMNTQRTNAGGWEYSEMREYVNGDIYNSLPQEIKNGIKSTKVISGHGSGDTTGTTSDYNFETTDKLYLLSAKEVWGSNPSGYDTAANETRQLDYYEKQEVTDYRSSKAIKNFEGRAFYWWLRSAYSYNTPSFYCVYDLGDWATNSATSTIGVAPAFRIG